MTPPPSDPARVAPPGPLAIFGGHFLVTFAAALPALLVYLCWFVSRFYDVATSDEKGWSVLTLPLMLAICAGIWASVAAPAALALSARTWPARIGLLVAAAVIAVKVAGWIGAPWFLQRGPEPVRLTSSMLFGFYFWPLATATWLMCGAARVLRAMALASEAAGERR